MATTLYLFTPHPSSLSLLTPTPLPLSPTPRFDWQVCTLPPSPTPPSLLLDSPPSPPVTLEVPAGGGRYALYMGELIPIEDAGRPILLITDLDDTLVSDDIRGKAAMRRFFRYWVKKHLFNGSKLVYSTGRTFFRYQRVFTDHSGVILPDLLVTGIGGEAFEVDCRSGEYKRLEELYRTELFDGWDSEVAGKVLKERFPYLMIKPCPGEDCPLSLLREITPSDADAHFAEIQAYMLNPQNEPRFGLTLHARTLLSGRRDRNLFIDFIPLQGGKRISVDFARERFGFSAESTFVAGDSGNDLDMFEGPEAGVLPSNSQPELTNWLTHSPFASYKYQSEAMYADAIVEMLEKRVDSGGDGR